MLTPSCPVSLVQSHWWKQLLLITESLRIWVIEVTAHPSLNLPHQWI
ncbi:unnamed protein product, partial [Staurois parvus]